MFEAVADENEKSKGNIEVETDIDALIMEIAQAQQELFHSDTSTIQQKRMKMSTGGNVDLFYQPITTTNILSGRRKAPLIMRSNSNASFIEIIGE